MNRKSASEILKVGTWNVQTLWSPGKLEILKHEIERYNCDVLGLSEMRWTGQGELNNGEIIWSGEEKRHVRGVGFYLSNKAKRALMGYNPVNPRIMAARFRGKPLNITVIQVYAPPAESSEEEIEEFYEKLEDTIAEVPRKDIKVVMGDWNAKVGSDNEGWEAAMGRYGYGYAGSRSMGPFQHLHLMTLTFKNIDLVMARGHRSCDTNSCTSCHQVSAE